MKRFFIVIFLCLIIMSGQAFAREVTVNMTGNSQQGSVSSTGQGHRFFTYGRNPMVPGGLRQPAPGRQFMSAPNDFFDCRMQGGSGEWVLGGVKKDTLLEVAQEGGWYIAKRVVACGNTLIGVKWPAPKPCPPPQPCPQPVQPVVVNNYISMGQSQNFYGIQGNARVEGAYYGPSPVLYYNNGNISTGTAVWDNYNIQNGNFNNSSSATGGNATQWQNQVQNSVNVNNNINRNNNVNQNQVIAPSSNANSNGGH